MRVLGGKEENIEGFEYTVDEDCAMLVGQPTNDSRKSRLVILSA